MRFNNRRRCLPMLIGLWAVTLAACTGHLLTSPGDSPPKPAANEHFAIIEASGEDSLASLAGRYYGDEAKAWRIAAFNGIDRIASGQRVVIPLVPIAPGGLKPEGYQVVPVLLYTSLARVPTNAHTVSEKSFQRQMDFLKEQGFVAVSLDAFHGYLDFKDELPPKAVVVSIDSTRSWVYELAYPVLKRLGMKGALFIRIGDVGRKDRLTWEQLAEMAANGMTIGLLGTKPSVSPQKDLKGYLDALETGLTEPQKAFRKYLKKPCRDFAYADGRPDDLMTSLLKEHGYRAAYTRLRGGNPFFMHAFRIRRTLIYGHADLERFRRNLSTFHKANLR